MRTFVIFVLSVLAFFFHTMIAPEIAVFSAKIDFIMISVILTALFTRKWYPPIFCALYSGIAVDIVTQSGTFVNTGIYLFIAGAVALSMFFIKENSLVISVLSVAVAVAVKHFLFVFILYLMRFNATLTFGTFINGLPSVLYTAAASLLIYFIYKFLFSLSFMQEKKDNEGRYL